MLFVSTVLPLPIDTPIPCLICTATAVQSAGTFTGEISASDPTGLTVYDFTARRSMTFTVPPGFHGLASADGTIANAGLARSKPGQLARVTYASSRGRNEALTVVLFKRETIPSKSLL